MSTTGVNWKIIFKTDAFMQHFYMFDWKKIFSANPLFGGIMKTLSKNSSKKHT
jgi:hypothetical protein